MVSASTRSASATAPSTSARTLPHAVAATVAPRVDGRAEVSRGRRADGSFEAPAGSPTASEDAHTQVIFGMSPMGRPRADRNLARAGVTTPSPTPKGPSVQDRIKALYGH